MAKNEQSRKYLLTINNPADCGLNASPTQVFRSFTPPQKGKGEMLSGTIDEMAGALVGKLVEKHLL